MTDLPVRQQPRWWLPDLWSDLFTGFPSSLAALRPGHLIKLEDEMEDGLRQLVVVKHRRPACAAGPSSAG